MKLITWNIQWGRGVDGRVDLERIVQDARAMAGFDAICMQEVADNFPGLEGNDERDQFAEISRLLPGFHRADGYGVDVDGGPRRRRFGNVIFTRYSILAIRRHALPWPADPGKESMPRVAVEVTLQAPMGPLRLTTTHLEYYSEAQRRAQALRLRHLHDEACQRAMEPGHPTTERGPFNATAQTRSSILCGDFNFPPEHAAYGEIQAALASGAPRYRDAWTLANGREPHTPTFCVHAKEYAKTPYCCDFVFVSDDMSRRVHRIEVNPETMASDHQPVLVEIDDR